MSPQKILNLREKRDIGQVVNASFAFLRLTYFKMFRDILLFVCPFFALSAICASLIRFSIPEYYGLPFINYFLNPAFYISIVLKFIGSTICYAIVSNYVLQYVQTGSTQFDRPAIRKKTGKQFFGLFTVNLFYYIANFGSLIFLIIPGIYFSVANVLSRPVYVLENVDEYRWVSIGDSFNESRRLITDNWWRTFGLYFILAFLVGFMSYIFAIPSLLVTFLIGFNSLRGGDLESYRLYYTLAEVIYQTGQSLLMPITISASCIYFYSLKESKDQTALLESIESFGTQAPASNTEYEGSY
jgi:hypothetical protein